MNLFYTPNITTSTYTLSEDESKHCIKVLRMKIGDELKLVDGRGGMYHACIAFDNPKACQLDIMEHIEAFEKRPYSLHLAIAPTKNPDRIEWMVEKAVEIGIDVISPIICEHSERKNINNERLMRIAVSAMKQSVKAYLPVINEAVSFKAFVQNAINGQKFIAHCIENNGQSKYSRHALQSACSKFEPVVCLIGPEGDFSAAEVDLAIDAGYRGISLGNSRLRTETAGLVACHTVYLNNL